jgi:hypothetical protein
MPPWYKRAANGRPSHQLVYDCDAHRAGCAFDLLHRAINIDRIQVFHLGSAICLTWARVILPTLSLFGTLEPLSTRRFANQTGAGDVFKTKVKEPSLYTVIPQAESRPDD